MTKRTAIILAGGESRRMNSRLSKVLHPILGYPILRYVIDAAVDAGVERLVLVANPKNEAGLKELVAQIPNIDISVCLQATAKGTADAVSSALPALGTLDADSGSVLVLCGDAPLIMSSTLQRFLDAHEQGSKAVSVLSGQVKDPFAYGRIVRDEQGQFVKIVEEKDATDAERQIDEINSGCLAFRGDCLEALLKQVPAAPNGEFYLTRTVDLALDQSLAVAAFSEIPEEEILGINTRAQLADATAILRERINAGHMERGVTLVDPQSAFIDKRAEIGRDTVIQPFVVIEGAVKIGEGCQVGPFARLRGESELSAGAKVGNFVEVTRSQMGQGSRALHLSYLGDTQLGSDVNIGAGVVFANWDGESKHRGFAKDGAFVGSGTIVIQPAGLSEGSRAGAGAVVTRTIPPGETWVGVPAKPLGQSQNNENQE